MGKLKLFVWEDVLEDYTCGIMFALAESVDQAREMIKAKNPNYEDDRIMKRDLKTDPKIIDQPEGFYSYGGG